MYIGDLTVIVTEECWRAVAMAAMLDWGIGMTQTEMRFAEEETEKFYA